MINQINYQFDELIDQFGYLITDCRFQDVQYVLIDFYYCFRVIGFAFCILFPRLTNFH